MKNLLNIITIILCVLLSWECTDGAENRGSGEISFHRIQVSSLFPSPSSSCVLSPRGEILSLANNTVQSLIIHFTIYAVWLPTRIRQI